MLSCSGHKVPSWMPNNIWAGKELKHVFTHVLLYDFVRVTEHVQGGDAYCLAGMLQCLEELPVFQSTRYESSHKNAEPDHNHHQVF